MNSSPYWISEAVPTLTILPPEVTGRFVPGLYPAMAVAKLPLLAPVTGLLVPGLMYPEMGLPELDMGLTI
jgi:Na+/H+ antiporter NhaA